MSEEEFSGLLFCPICCSVVDVITTGTVTFTCGSCGTETTTVVDPAVVAQHAIHG